jgi:hypothetical protein
MTFSKQTKGSEDFDESKTDAKNIGRAQND